MGLSTVIVERDRHPRALGLIFETTDKDEGRVKYLAISKLADVLAHRHYSTRAGEKAELFQVASQPHGGDA